MTEEVTVENWLAVRKEEGLKIEPSTLYLTKGPRACWHTLQTPPFQFS
jgi:hypothetical protein